MSAPNQSTGVKFLDCPYDVQQQSENKKDGFICDFSRLICFKLLLASAEFGNYHRQRKVSRTRLKAVVALTLE